jgi:hypothetical protein
MKFSKEDKKEYAGWLEGLIAKEYNKPESIFTIKNTYELTKDLADINKQINK